MSTTAELVAFLLARIAEDEAVAREAAADRAPTWRQATDPGVVHDDPAGGVVVDMDEAFPEIVVYDEGRPSIAEAAHIALHDPARVLAECEAKRRIVETYHDHLENGQSSTGFHDCGDDCTGGAMIWTLRLLALPYAAHEGFREEWRA